MEEDDGKLQSFMGNHGEEKNQSVQADQGIWAEFRSDEPVEKEYICFNPYVGDAVQDSGLQDRGRDGGKF